VKLGKNASDTCAMLSEAYGGQAIKMSSVSCHINGSTGFAKTWKMIERSDRPRSRRTDGNAEKVRNLVHSHKSKQSTKLIMWIY
jgi:hypothetical protein